MFDEHDADATASATHRCGLCLAADRVRHEREGLTEGDAQGDSNRTLDN